MKTWKNRCKKLKREGKYNDLTIEKIEEVLTRINERVEVIR